MFEGASMILVPPTGMAIETVAKAKALSLELDFERVVITDAAEHDRMIAYTSQMAHVVSSAYVQSPCSLRHRGFSARQLSRYDPRRLPAGGHVDRVVP